MPKTAVLLLGFGGPEKMGDVGPFVENITGRKLPPERLAATEEKYRLIGGCSPLRKTSEAQGRLIEQKLSAKYPDLRVYLGMRYWHPLNSQTVKEMVKDGVERIILVPLSPYYSHATSREYINDATLNIRALSQDIEIIEIRAWNTEAALVEGFANTLRRAVNEAEENTPIVFTAHSIPLDMAEGGDPYPEQIAETAGLVARAAGVDNFRLSWQSEGHGRGEWLKPSVADIFDELAAAGASSVTVMPIGFTADHVETLYDIDIEMRNRAREAGLSFGRASCLNTDNSVIDAMSAAIGRAL